MVIDGIRGLRPEAFCIADLWRPTPETEQTLAAIGKGGRLKVTGAASAEENGLCALRLDAVYSVEAIDRPPGDPGTDHRLPDSGRDQSSTGTSAAHASLDGEARYRAADVLKPQETDQPRRPRPAQRSETPIG